VERALRQLTPTVAGSLEAGLQERTRFSTNERVAMADAIENRFGPGLSRALFAA
jgi:hypothetical protein